MSIVYSTLRLYIGADSAPGELKGKKRLGFWVFLVGLLIQRLYTLSSVFCNV